MSISFHARDNGFTHVCGHRGFSLHYPENTIRAFDETRKAGGTTCEIDVLLTRDNEVIVLHDMTLDRTTTGFGYAGDLDWASIEHLDAGVKKDPSFSGTRVPTLRETVLWAKTHNMGLEVELKDDDRPDLLAGRVLEVLDETNGFGHVIIISFNHKELARLKVKDARIRTEVITHAGHADLVHVLKSCGAESVSIELNMFDPKDARALHDAGLCNRVHLPRPLKLAVSWSHGRDVLPRVSDWLREGLIDSISGDDVSFLRKLVDKATAGSRQ